MSIRLMDIPGLSVESQRCWRVKALEINGRYPVLNALLRWKRDSPDDYMKIMKVLRLVGSSDKIRDVRKVKKNENPEHGEVYEMRADKGHARVLFFYSIEEESVVVCTNEFWKTSNNRKPQDEAFAKCARLKVLYEGGSGDEGEQDSLE